MFCFFFIGALPFFSYYALDPQSKVLGLGAGYSLRNLKEGLPLFFLERIHYFLDLEKFRSLNELYFWAGVIIYTGAAVLFFGSLLKERRFLLNPQKWSGLSSGYLLGILGLVFLGILASSVHIHRNAARYFLPLATFFPIALAYGVDRFPKRWKFVPVLFLLLLFYIQMGVTWKYVTKEAPLSEAATQKHITLAHELLRQKIGPVYSWQVPGSELINFYSNERVIASRPMMERYRPYEDVLERSDQVTFLDPGDKPIMPSLRIIGGDCSRGVIGDYNYYHGFNPPSRSYREIPPEGILLSASHKNGNVMKMTDRRLDTGWSSGQFRSPDMWLRIDLGRAYPLGLIRLFNPGAQHGCYSLNLEILTSQNGSNWERVIPQTQMDLYYWDGPRIYYWELNYRWECRFRPVEARYILIKNYEREERFPWNIGELYVFEDLGESQGDGFDPAHLMEKIRTMGLTKIYAGRWLSAKIKEKFGGVIQTVPIFTEASFARWPRSRVVSFGPRTGFIVDSQDQPGFEAMLNQRQIRLEQVPVGRWKIYYFKQWGSAEKILEQDKSLWWTGFGVLSVGPETWGEFHRRGLVSWQ